MSVRSIKSLFTFCEPDCRNVGVFYRETAKVNNEFHHCQHVRNWAIVGRYANQPTGNVHFIVAAEVELVGIVG
jgi:hypothetical protein